MAQFCNFGTSCHKPDCTFVHPCLFGVNCPMIFGEAAADSLGRTTSISCCPSAHFPEVLRGVLPGYSCGKDELQHKCKFGVFCANITTTCTRHAPRIVDLATKMDPGNQMTNLERGSQLIKCLIPEVLQAAQKVAANWATLHQKMVASMAEKYREKKAAASAASDDAAADVISSDDGTGVVNEPPTGKASSPRFKSKPCHWGDKCRNKDKCTFLH